MPTRVELAELLGAWMRHDFAEAEEEHLFSYLERHLPDPEWTAIIYWPTHHPIASQRGVTDPSPADVVDIAFEYRPIAL
jgi:hypothetical protein